ncbi:hypothetical protein DYL59_23340 [Pseudomonas kairouanensis]|uniref:Type III secretion protein n=1 Tax=Pseudomonas kairouanensis TaxID=2293832 RepID=A0A4Z0AHJ1_9PSED|nr:hypothetical protein [Pseudomonas kairouanensis]TFY86075.1 hypothetical protein DYL59_23340 [Pseudomonas kairouanensis]
MDAISGFSAMSSLGNFGNASQQGGGADALMKQIADLQKQLQAKGTEGSGGAQGSGGAEDIMELIKKLMEQLTQAAQSGQGAQAGDQGESGQITMVAAQSKGSISF